MRKTLQNLHTFYPKKRDLCYKSVSSFKYPFTIMSELAILRFSPVMIWCTDKLQILRMYEMVYVAVRTIDDIADEGDSKQGENIY